MPVELEEAGWEAPPNIPLDGVVSLLSLDLLGTVWLPKTEAEVVPVASVVFAAAEPPNTEGAAEDVPKIAVVLLLVDPPNIPPVEAEELVRDPPPPPPNIPLGGEAAFSFPVLLAADGVPNRDVPDDDEVAPVVMLDCPVAAVVTALEPNTDLFGAVKAVKGEGSPEVLPESVVVGVTEADAGETVLLEPPIPNTEEVEVEVVIPPKTDDVVAVDADEIWPKNPAVAASFPVVVTVLLAPPSPKALAVVAGVDWTMTEAEFDPKEDVS